MTLSNKQKALLATLGLIAVSVVVGLLLQFIGENVNPDVILKCIGFGFMTWLLYLVYAILLARFEYQDSMKKLDVSIENLQKNNTKV